MNRLLSSFRNVLRRNIVDNDLDAEINAHRQLLEDENIASGLNPLQAQRLAAQELGSVEQVKEEVRSRRAGQWMEQLWQDVRYGLRMLRKSPAFTMMAAITLALGIGANTAMFSVINSVLLQGPPFREPSKVMAVLQKQPNGATNSFSTPDYLEWKRQTGPVTQMAAMVSSSGTLGTKDGVERITGWQASSEMFSVLGVAPVLGRGFIADEDRQGAGSVIVISDSLWKTHFQSDPNILGAKLNLDGVPYTVIGVMPPGFQIDPYAPTEQYWRPLQLATQDTVASSRTVHWLLAMVRLEPGATIKKAQSELDAVAARLHRADPNGDAGFGLTLQTFQDYATGGLRGPLLLLMGCVGFVLLIACSNVANLLLARGTARRLEMSIRAAIGAQRSRVVRQLLTESVLLSLLGGTLGLLLAVTALKILVALHPVFLPNLHAISVNTTILAFTTTVCLGVGVLFGIVPALVASRVDLSNALRETSRGAGRSTGKHRVALVVVETAMACILLIGAGLSLKSLLKVTRVDPGFNPSGLLTFRIAAPDSAKDRYLFYQQVAERVGALPGVQSTVLARNIPFSGMDPSMPVGVDGHPPQVTDGQVVTRLRLIGPNYFHAFQTPLLRGREFTDDDTATSPPVAIVSQSLAQRYWPNQNPLGRTLKPNLADAPWYTVIGVAADVHQLGLDADIEPTAYYLYPQFPKSLTPLATRFTTVVVRSSNLSGLAEAVRRAVAGVDKTVPIFDLQTVDQMLLDAGSLRRFDLWLFAAFAGLALVLAAIGVYGVMAYSVSQRTREIGIRMALGATRQDVLRMVVGQGVKMAVAGVVVGAAGAAALTRLMADLLYQVSPTDVWTFALVSLTVIGCILLACYVPSRRATKVDPNVALRYE
jgi:putative ABC transport system permease protein